MMIRRHFIHLCLLALFAIVQMGVVTHEISHLNPKIDVNHSKKNTVNEQCGQCIAYAQTAHASAPPTFELHLLKDQFFFATKQAARLKSRLTAPYSARAPPVFSMS